MAKDLRLYLIEDHEGLRRSYCAFLEAQTGFLVCGDSPTAEDAAEEIAGADPDLVLVDISLPGMTGLEFARRFSADFPIAMLTGHDDSIYADQADAAGAIAFIRKTGGPRELLAQLRDLRTRLMGNGAS